MSHSYRKPWYVDGYGSRSKRLSKREANKRIRRSNDVPDGKAYRRFYDPWDICDYKYPYDPHPYVRVNWFNTGRLEWVYPEPIWKARRK